MDELHPCVCMSVSQELSGSLQNALACNLQAPPSHFYGIHLSCMSASDERREHHMKITGRLRQSDSELALALTHSLWIGLSLRSTIRCPDRNVPYLMTPPPNFSISPDPSIDPMTSSPQLIQ
ncbi:unnamed protein product [Acanthocheilonema viteae]|uniref:Uncharacterized protein n=1 Tax=Acanthocheilonema viteae TaxID=6277 RepID=A0A498SMR4_ACAVI|nr:unnamed protein product [Acanthocheilonema viteae]